MEPTAILVDMVRHPASRDLILKTDPPLGFFGKGSNGFPHEGIHLAADAFYATANGELLAARLEGDHPFLLLRHYLPLQGNDPLCFYTLFANFTPWSKLTQKKRSRLRVLAKRLCPAFVKEDEKTRPTWHPGRGLALLNAQDGKLAGVIPFMHEALLLESSDPPPGYKTKGWKRIRYGELEGLACLRTNDFKRLEGNRICILAISTPIPKGQTIEATIPLYTSEKASKLAACVSAYTLAEAELINEDWALLHTIQDRSLKKPLYIKREHLALGADPMPGQEEIWEGCRPLTAGTPLGYAAELHWECFLSVDPRTLPEPHLSRLLPPGSWKEFCAYPPGFVLYGQNEWAGFTPALEAAANDTNREKAKENYGQSRWWTPYMERVLDLPPAHSLYHAHPLLFAARCNLLRSKRPKNILGLPLSQDDWMDCNALISLLALEMQKLGVQSGSPEVIPLYRALHARLHTCAPDWQHCFSGKDLLKDAYGPRCEVQTVEDWLNTTQFSDEEAMAFASIWAIAPTDAMTHLRLYHPVGQALKDQGWQLETLECKGGHDPCPQTIGKLNFYTPHRPERGYLIRPVPVLKAQPSCARKGQKVTISLDGWKPAPPPGTPEKHLEWSLWGNGKVQSVQKGGGSISMDMPSSLDPPLLVATARYNADGHPSHSQASVLFSGEERRLFAEKTTGETIKESVLQSPDMLAHYLDRLGYWCSSPKHCSSPLRALQLEHGLPVTGKQDEASNHLIAKLLEEGAYAKELRGRPGIKLKIHPSNSQAFTTRFYQLPPPSKQEYTPYGDTLECRQNGSVLDTCYANEKWGQKPMVIALEKLLCQWHEEKGDRIAVNDLSYYLGGPSICHASHQVGLDVDLRSTKVGACVISGAKNRFYDQQLTIEFIDMAMDLGFRRFCTFDKGLVEHFAKDHRGKVAVVSEHEHHLHLHFGP